MKMLMMTMKKIEGKPNLMLKRQKISAEQKRKPNLEVRNLYNLSLRERKRKRRRDVVAERMRMRKTELVTQLKE